MKRKLLFISLFFLIFFSSCSLLNLQTKSEKEIILEQLGVNCINQSKSTDVEYLIKINRIQIFTDKGIDCSLIERLKIYDGKKYGAIIQFENKPTKIDIENLKAENITISSPIREKALLVLIPNDVTILSRIQNKSEIRWIGLLPAEAKMQLALKNQISKNIEDNSTIYLNVMFLDGITKAEAESIIQSYNGKCMGYVSVINSCSTEISRKEIINLANDLNVNWIEIMMPSTSFANE